MIEFEGIEAYIGIIAAVLTLIVVSVRAIYSTYVQELFMTNKQKEKNNVYKLIGLMGLLFIMNYVYLSIEWIDIVGLIGFFVFVNYAYRGWKNEINELNTYYSNRKILSLITVIVLFGPEAVRMLEKQNILSQKVICVLIVSLVQILFIVITTPQILNISEAKCYYLDKDDDKWYLYYRIDDNNILCGDSSKVGLADKYKTITNDELKENVILRNKVQKLGYKDAKQINKEAKDRKKEAKKMKNKIKKENKVKCKFKIPRK